MMFRKLYWVTEHVTPKGASEIVGVYTSIPHLLQSGLGHAPRGCRLRLTLTKLDCPEGPLGRWTESQFDQLEKDLSQFIETEEFSKEHCASLCSALKQRQLVAA